MWCNDLMTGRRVCAYPLICFVWICDEMFALVGTCLCRSDLIGFGIVQNKTPQVYWALPCSRDSTDVISHLSIIIDMMFLFPLSALFLIICTR